MTVLCILFSGELFTQLWLKEILASYSGEQNNSTCRLAVMWDPETASEIVSISHAYNLGLRNSDLNLLDDLDPLEPNVRVMAQKYPRDTVSFLHSMGKEKRARVKSLLAEDTEQRVDQYSQECRQVLNSWKAAKPTIGYSENSKLPLDVWIRILEHLSDDMQLDDIRGPSVVARDLCNASMTSKDLHAASLPAFQRLSSLCPRKDFEHHWQYVLSDPWNSELLSDSAITALLRVAKLREFGSREVKVIMLYRSVNQAQPTRLPARLILTVLEEKKHVKHLIEARKLEAIDASQGSDFYYRAELTELGIPSLHFLQQLCEHLNNYET